MDTMSAYESVKNLLNGWVINQDTFEQGWVEMLGVLSGQPVVYVNYHNNDPWVVYKGLEIYKITTPTIPEDGF